MNKSKLRVNSKQAVTFVAAVMLLLLYMIIFSFSAQDAEQSGGLSHMISEKCVDIMNALAGKTWTTIFKQELINYFEHPIRKFAHFAEYACMGILVYTMWRPWLERGRKLYLLTIVWVFLSAAGDEFHQLFVPGRYASFADTLLDTFGGACGVILCVTTEKIYRHIIINRARKRARGITSKDQTMKPKYKHKN